MARYLVHVARAEGPSREPTKVCDHSPRSTEAGFPSTPTGTTQAAPAGPGTWGFVQDPAS